jgi:predicted DNA-binding ribbon-helix-helix protein
MIASKVRSVLHLGTCPRAAIPLNCVKRAEKQGAHSSLGGKSLCQIYASQLPDTYAYVTRSVRLNGYSTSIKIEAKFWRVLEEIARQEGVALTSFLATLHDEAEAIHGEVRNFASLLRCTCLIYLSERHERALAETGHRPAAKQVSSPVPCSTTVTPTTA